MLDFASDQKKIINTLPKKGKKELGQFFTPPMIADYMASMIYPVQNTETVRLLDAGAGTGILAAAAAIQCLAAGHRAVHAVLYEIDTTLLPTLRSNMEHISRSFRQKDAVFTYDIRHEDFVLARPDRTEPPFHISSINPPYFKYNTKHSPYSEAAADLFKGNPNIYASFMAIVGKCLAPEGQMIAIVPRSFANGLYFKGFRKFLYHNMSLERIHTFHSRGQVFKNMNVLQENVICKYVKRKQTDNITICSSNCSDDIHNSEISTYPAHLIINTANDLHMIRIPETFHEGRILKTIDNWKNSFGGLGYIISTGPVVEHRTREFITAEHPENSVPLLRMHNIKPFRTEWTGRHRKDVRFMLLYGHAKHTVRNSVYVILKRFSSKDEKRRLVAGVHSPERIAGQLISFENHLNYITRKQKMGLAEAYGLAGLFNSTVIDKYFRCISGNTQVNATEIRLLRLPSRNNILNIGEFLLNKKNTDQEIIDEIVNRECLNEYGISGPHGIQKKCRRNCLGNRSLDCGQSGSYDSFRRRTLFGTV
jgi:adenine-specific DNA-methyltransferase